MSKLSGNDLRSAALARLEWRQGIQGQVIDTDIDGLLSAALCHEQWGWPVVGFYDTHTLWLSSDVPTPVDLTTIAWVDLDMTWPGTLSLSQHVVPHRHEDLEHLPFLQTTVNPSVLRGVSTDSTYPSKYPFGTFQWLWWVMDKPVDDARLDTEEGMGLAWMPDGGYKSMRSYEPNLRNWGTTILPGSLLSPLTALDEDAVTISERAERNVQSAQRLLTDATNRAGWTRSHQWTSAIPLNARESPVEKQAFLRGVQGLLDKITDFYGWARVTLPQQYQDWFGFHHRGERVAPGASSEWGWHPPGWPRSASGEIVSAAATGRWKGSWTTPAHPDLPHRKRLDRAFG